MPKKPPPVSLRKPPAAVDLDRAEAFVRKPEEPKDVKTPERLNVKAAERLDAQTSKQSATQTSEGVSVQTAGRLDVSADTAKGRALPRGVVARSDGRTLRRMTVYLPDDLARKLAVSCARKGQEMSAVVSDAVRRHLAAEPDE